MSKIKVVPVQLDKERNLKFAVSTVYQVEQLTGKAMKDINMEGMEGFYAMLTACLVWEDKSLTIDKMMDIIDEIVAEKMEKEGLAMADAMTEMMTYLGEKIEEVQGGPQGTAQFPSKK